MVRAPRLAARPWVGRRVDEEVDVVRQRVRSERNVVKARYRLVRAFGRYDAFQMLGHVPSSSSSRLPPLTECH